MACPLCFSTKTVLKDTLPVADIVSRWQRDQKIDVRSEFGEVAVIELYRCLECTLEFFKPDSVAGTAALYEKLEHLEGYYLPRKWEHDTALQDMNGARNGLEIGCGLGDFVSRVAREKHISFEGLEQSPSAVRAGQSRGVPIRLATVEEMAQSHPGAYDVVCGFQVLEHVIDPRGFIESACTVLRPGGRLIIGVPNAKSFIKRAINVYDMPPHHVTRWSDEVLMRLQRWFPLKLIRVAYEPLPEYRVEWYVEIHEDILRRHGLGSLVHPWIRSRIIRLVRNAKIRRFLRGDTIYASYVREYDGPTRMKGFSK